MADELELDIAGLVGSYLLTQSVRTLLSGHYPAPHLLLISSDPHGHGEHAVRPARYRDLQHVIESGRRSVHHRATHF